VNLKLGTHFQKESIFIILKLNMFLWFWRW